LIVSYDLNDALDNYAFPCGRRAASCRQAAEAARAAIVPDWPDYAQAGEREARRQAAEAARWTARGEAAARGVMRVETDDLVHLREFDPLISHARAAGRADEVVIPS
jgi:hypothetical protein